MKNFFFFSFCFFALLACEKKEEAKVEEAKMEEPKRVEVQHILIAFKGSLPGKEVERTKEQAETKASELFQQAQAKPDEFEKLVVAHSDDMVPGIYALANEGEERKGEEFSRSHFRKSFGDLAFKLEVGGLGIVMYDEEKSPYGYHIIKRLK